MNSNLIIVNLTRFIALLLMQVLIFQRISLGWSDSNYISILIYPVFIMLLPVELPIALTVVIAFLFGIALDMFYNSPGIHAGTCVFMGYFRYYILGFLEPKGGYANNSGPTQFKLGSAWFIRYASIFTLIHLFIYFSIEAFSFVYIIKILISTFLSFFFSMLFIVIYQFLLDPKE